MHRRAARSSAAKYHPTDETGVGGLVRRERTRVRLCILADAGCQSVSVAFTWHSWQAVEAAAEEGAPTSRPRGPRPSSRGCLLFRPRGVRTALPGTNIRAVLVAVSQQRCSEQASLPSSLPCYSSSLPIRSWPQRARERQEPLDVRTSSCVFLPFRLFDLLSSRFLRRRCLHRYPSPDWLMCQSGTEDSLCKILAAHSPSSELT